MVHRGRKTQTMHWQRPIMNLIAMNIFVEYGPPTGVKAHSKVKTMFNATAVERTVLCSNLRSK